MALKSSIQELKEPVEDETGGEDQLALDSMTINLDPFPGSTIPQSTYHPHNASMEFHEVGYRICSSKD